MDTYVTGQTIRLLRKGKGLTQAELARRLLVSDKTVSKWETGRGYPDGAMLLPLAQALGVSLVELLSASPVKNLNRSFNIPRSKFYVCPLCGNVIWSTGEFVAACCGLTLPAEQPQEADEAHGISVEEVEDELYVSLSHPMAKEHFISFLAVLTDDRADIVKLYPEGEAAARFKRGRVRAVLARCNQHGLFVWKPKKK